MKVPVLMITYNRLEYTKQALKALIESDCGTIYIIDNGSTDGTERWLKDKLISTNPDHRISCFFMYENTGIAGAMNVFLKLTADQPVVAKVDNDTIVPPDFFNRMLPCLQECHIVQAKHHIIPATDPLGWHHFVKDMREIAPGLRVNHFVGGSGILFDRKIVDAIPQTGWMLGGWREFQRHRPDLIKAFYDKVEIKLLDEHGYSDYPDYYKQTKRLQ